LPLELRDALPVTPFLFRFIRVQLPIDGLRQLRDQARLGFAHLVKLCGVGLGYDLVAEGTYMLVQIYRAGFAHGIPNGLFENGRLHAQRRTKTFARHAVPI
jgi:hypothetical protein